MRHPISDQDLRFFRTQHQCHTADPRDRCRSCSMADRIDELREELERARAMQARLRDKLKELLSIWPMRSRE